MNKLTYRGIHYSPQTTATQTEVKVGKRNRQTPVDRCGSRNHQNLDRLVSIKPMHYYTYRGVSYIKTIICDRDKKILLDLDRQ